MLIDIANCSFPCASDIDDAISVISYICSEWNRTDWITKLFKKENIPLRFEQIELSEDNSLLFIISKNTQNKRAFINCDDQLFVDASNLIKNNTQSYLTKVSLERFSVSTTSYSDSSCAIALSVEKYPVQYKSNFDYIIGIVFGALFIVLLISFFIYKRNQKITNIKQLPEEVGWAFKSAALDIFRSWERTENYYHKELIPQSREHNRVKHLFDNFLNGNNLSILKIIAVYKKLG